jgi:tRNA nucleotidyltransferase (CCA-adding enzyme)
MTLPEILQNLSNTLQIPLYLVGGAVRDYLLGQQVKDYDLTTPVLPDEVEAVIRRAGYKPYTLGKKFGTIGLKFSISGKTELVEITTFRQEEYTSGSRKPSVEFVSDIQSDLSRRDFTINAMAMDAEGKLIDPFVGQADLSANIIRAVGNAKIRFKEDPLRILRAFRLAAVLSFEIQPETLTKAEEKKWSLLNISKERWVMELDKILASEGVVVGLDYLMNSGVMRVILPEVSLQKDYDQDSPYHRSDLWTHTKKVVAGVPQESLDLRWAALLHDIGKPFCRTKNIKGYSNYIGHELAGAEMALKICRYLKFSNQRTEFIVSQVRGHMQDESPLRGADNAAK